jgi:hypothetical protein
MDAGLILALIGYDSGAELKRSTPRRLRSTLRRLPLAHTPVRHQ